MKKNEEDHIPIRTHIPKSLWIKATMQDIVWKKALIDGIKFRLCINTKKEDLIKQIQHTKNELELLNRELTELEKKEKENKKKDDSLTIMKW